MALTFFFDSYALFELLHANPEYLRKTQGSAILTTQLNLMELHFVLLRTYGAVFADNAFDALAHTVVPIPDVIIKEANGLKLKLNTRDVSYVDCIGYCLARSRGVKFLTGDKQFENLDNVEFLK